MTRSLVAVAMEADGGLADQFDKIEDLLPLLLADRVTENPAEQANIILQLPIWLGSKFRSVCFLVHLSAPAACGASFYLDL